MWSGHEYILQTVTPGKRSCRAHGEFFSDIRPASTFVEVSRLIDPAWMVEIEAQNANWSKDHNIRMDTHPWNCDRPVTGQVSNIFRPLLLRGPE